MVLTKLRGWMSNNSSSLLMMGILTVTLTVYILFMFVLGSMSHDIRQEHTITKEIECKTDLKDFGFEFRMVERIDTGFLGDVNYNCWGTNKEGAPAQIW